MPWLRKSCGRTGTTTTTFHRSPGWSPSPSRLTGRTRSSKSAVRIQLRSRHGNDNRSGRIGRSSSSTRVGHLRGLLPPLHPLSVHQHLTPSSRAEPSKPSFLLLLPILHRALSSYSSSSSAYPDHHQSIHKSTSQNPQQRRIAYTCHRGKRKLHKFSVPAPPRVLSWFRSLQSSDRAGVRRSQWPWLRRELLLPTP